MSHTQDRINELLLKRLEEEEEQKNFWARSREDFKKWNTECLAREEREEREQAKAKAYRLNNPDAWVKCPTCDGDGCAGGDSISTCSRCDGRRVIQAKHYPGD